MTAFTSREFLADAAGLVERHRAAIRADLEAIPEDRIWDRPVPGLVSAANQGAALWLEYGPWTVSHVTVVGSVNTSVVNVSTSSRDSMERPRG